MNTRKRLLSKLVSVACAATMICGLMTCAVSAEESDSDYLSNLIIPECDEHVALNVVAFVSSDEADGLRSDPVSQWLEETLNIDLYLTAVTEADWPTQLAAMMASGDLPDIFLLSDDTKQLPMLLESGSALNLEPYLEDYAPNTMADPGGQMMIEAERLPASSPDGNMYLWGLCKGSWDDGTLPTCGHYLRWDLYKEAGYPEITGFDETLLDALEAMVALEPETADGEKTYGVGSWFGDGQDWGEWVFTYGLAPQEGADLITTTGRTLAVSTVDSTPLENNQLTDPDGYFWRSVRFYNMANQRGLLDPDSFTMSSDMYEEKLKAGKYMFNTAGWMSSDANLEFNKTEGNLKTFISMPSLGSDAESRYGDMYRGERQYVVNANTKYPERCVALLDLVSTYEFSRLAWNGVEGMEWNMEDGEPVPTEEYLQATKDDALAVETGTNVYHHFCGYGNGTIEPSTGVAVDLYQFSDAALDLAANDTVKDFISYYGQETQNDVYRAETPVTDGQDYITFSDPEGDIAEYVNDINAYVGTNIFKAVAADSDDEFYEIQDEIITQLQDNYHVDEVFDYFYNEALEQADDVATMVEMSAEVAESRAQ